MPSRAPPDSRWVTWPLCPHTCQFCCFLFSFSLCTRVRLGTVSSCSVFRPHARPFERCSFLSVASGPTSPGPQNGQPRAGAGNSHHRPHLAHPTAACGCSVPPCPGQHLSLPFPMTRWFWILAAAGEEKSREMNCGSGAWSVWASEAPLLLLKTREVVCGQGSEWRKWIYSCFSEGELWCSGGK